jgi:hypothetical protein
LIYRGGTEAGVGTTAEAEIAVESQEVDLRVIDADPVGAAVGGTVIDDEDFASRMGFDCGEPGGEEFFEKIAAVPVWNDQGRRAGGGFAIRVRDARDEEGDEIREGERERGNQEKKGCEEQ